MMHKLTIFSCLIISATCTYLHQPAIQVPLLVPFRIQDPNYSFSYNVNEASTGDIKSQEERRHGGVTTGQYSLVQPDGIRRTVDYRADDLTGFRATINNNRDNIPVEEVKEDIVPQRAEHVTQAPVAVSRSSVYQTINVHHIVNPWV